jgi:N-acetyl-beta-hexosaminidase
VDVPNFETQPRHTIAAPRARAHLATSRAHFARSLGNLAPINRRATTVTRTRELLRELSQSRADGRWPPPLPNAALDVLCRAGISHGVRTAAQLLNGLGDTSLPSLRIVDAPVYTYRGVMIDNVRQAHGFAFHSEMLDRLAASKLNVYQLHASDGA